LSGQDDKKQWIEGDLKLQIGIFFEQENSVTESSEENNVDLIQIRGG
jgi:hypothetical protein